MTERNPLSDITFGVIRNGYDQSDVQARLHEAGQDVLRLQALLAAERDRAEGAVRELKRLADTAPDVGALPAALDELPPPDDLSVAAVDRTDFAEARRGYTPGEVNYFFDELRTKVDQLQSLVRTITRRADVADAQVRAVRAALGLAAPDPTPPAATTGLFDDPVADVAPDEPEAPVAGDGDELLPDRGR